MYEAACAGRTVWVERLLSLHQQDRARHPISWYSLVAGTAHGCPLDTLRRAVEAWVAHTPWGRSQGERQGLLQAAATSPTPDWLGKVAYLVKHLGYPGAGLHACTAAARYTPAEVCDGCANSGSNGGSNGAGNGAGSSTAAAGGSGRTDGSVLGGGGGGGPSEPDCALVRLRTLHGLYGLPLEDASLVAHAAGTGDARAVECLLSQGARVLCGAATQAAQGGHLAVLRALHSRGHAVALEEVARAAAGGGHLGVLQWLAGLCAPVQRPARAQRVPAAGGGGAPRGARAEAGAAQQRGGVQARVRAQAGGKQRSQRAGEQGSAQAAADAPRASEVFTVRVAAAAAGSGSVELLRWLHDQQACPLDPTGAAFAKAAGAGCGEALELLAARGCCMGADGEAYIEAGCHADVRTLRLLRRLGCPWTARTFTRAVFRSRTVASSPVEVLGWMLREGCPVDWQDAMEAARLEDTPEVIQFVERHKARAQRQARRVEQGG